jgi:mannose-6-phosphate isomerase-like protein (cupin superfamily)
MAIGSLKIGVGNIVKTTLLLLGCLATAGFAQNNPIEIPPVDKAMYFSEADLDAILATVPLDKADQSGSLSKRLFTASTFSTSFIRLTEPDRAKAHGAWSEMFVIKSGSGTVQTGGTITGEITSDSRAHSSIFLDPGAPTAQSEAEAKAAAAARAAQGDKSGTEQVGGVIQHVSAGDVILIPAGVAHRWTQIDGQVVYLAIKFPKAK